jgi:hypothetical protein
METLSEKGTTLEKLVVRGGFQAGRFREVKKEGRLAVGARSE